MIGTPKQIEWAERIREGFVRSILVWLNASAKGKRGADFADMLAAVNTAPTETTLWAVMADAFEEAGHEGGIAFRRIAAILSRDSAAWWIKNRWIENGIPLRSLAACTPDVAELFGE